MGSRPYLAQRVALREAFHGGGHKSCHDAEVARRHGAAAVNAEGAHRLLLAAGCHARDDCLQLIAAQALLVVLCLAVCLVLGPVRMQCSCFVQA